jgi:hypothetical protein
MRDIKVGRFYSLSDGNEKAKPWMNEIGPFLFFYTHCFSWRGPEMWGWEAKSKERRSSPYLIERCERSWKA